MLFSRISEWVALSTIGRLLERKLRYSFTARVFGSDDSDGLWGRKKWKKWRGHWVTVSLGFALIGMCIPNKAKMRIRKWNETIEDNKKMRYYRWASSSGHSGRHIYDVLKKNRSFHCWCCCEYFRRIMNFHPKIMSAFGKEKIIKLVRTLKLSICNRYPKESNDEWNRKFHWRANFVSL